MPKSKRQETAPKALRGGIDVPNINSADSRSSNLGQKQFFEEQEKKEAKNQKPQLDLRAGYLKVPPARRLILHSAETHDAM